VCFIGGVLRCGIADEPDPNPTGRLVVREIKDIRTGETLAGMIRENGRLALPSGRNSIRVTAAFLDFRASHYSKFKIWVDGIEKEPGAWSQESVRDLTNLPSGSYLLHVQGHDGIGLQYQSVAIRLAIARPWYKTPAAIAGYGVIGLLFVGVLVRVREMRLRWNNRQLARAVEDGRKEIGAKNRELQNTLLRTEGFARDLAVANTALKKSTQAKTEFVRMVSHELRNPIAGARMTAELLCESETDATRQHQATNLSNSLQYLQTLLDETLDLTQAESGHTALKLEQFSVASLLAEVAGMFEGIAHEKHLKFLVTPGPNSDQLLLGDKTHSKRILVNYLSNAFKFTATGTVALRAQPVPQEAGLCRVRFEVSDTGPGVSEAIQGRIFGEFVRESSHAEGDSMPGAGLGLALCRQLAELCGGSVGYSTKRGEGSLFWAELPFIALNAEASVGVDAEDLRPDFSDLRVCLIDDDPLQLQAMTAALEEFGAVPAVAKTADEALALLRTKTFDVVIMDYRVGQENGIDLLLKARGSGLLLDNASTRWHLVTGLWDDALPEKAKAAGFLGAHRKPLSLVAIFNILQAARQA